MAFFVPGIPGHYLDGLVLFGIVPTIAGGALLASVGALSAKWRGSPRLARAAVNMIFLGVATVWLLYIVMGLFSKSQI
jgi:VIT1/CCC1 family predicted Fe2+/Mn2+ transporter